MVGMETAWKRRGALLLCVLSVLTFMTSGSVATAAIPRAPEARPAITAFRHLGTWVDLYDYSLDPAASVRTMRAHGVGTLFLQTGRFNRIADPSMVGRWIERAHAIGMKVVGWYLPGYSEHLNNDVLRTLAIASYQSPSGQRFDALAVDIEYQGASSSRAEFNHDITTHLRRVRQRVGSSYPVGAITPAPLGMELYPRYWRGFPWASIGRYANVVLPMGYWSYRSDCPTNSLHCPYQYTRGNILRAGRYTALPVHIIGGVGDSISARGVVSFVRGARDTAAYGGSLYDYRTTSRSWWSTLRLLNLLDEGVRPRTVASR